MLKERNGHYIPILNLLRGVASLGVVAVHMHYSAGLYGFPYIGYILSNGQLGVPIFFVISGLVIPYSLWNSKYEIKNFFSFILKRSVRIDPPYLLVIAICLVAGLFTPEYVFDIKRILLHLSYLIPFSHYSWYQGVFWTLGIEFQFYLLIGLLLPLIIRANIYLLMTALITIAIFGYFLPIQRPDPFIFRHIHYFVIGLIILLFKKQRLSLLAAHLYIGIIVAVFCVEVSMRTGIIGYITAFVILHVSFETRITDFLGRISYSLYLTHTLTGELLIFLIGGWGINPYTLFAILVICCIANGYLFYMLIEKWAIDWSKKINVKQPVNGLAT